MNRFTSGVLIAVFGLTLVACSATTPEDSGLPMSSGGPTAYDGEATYDADLDLWLADGWPVPDPSATFDPDAPYISPQEANTKLMACLSENGWDLKAEGTTSYSGNVPPEQWESYKRDLKDCLIQNRIGIDPAPPLTPELARNEYEAQQQTRSCLVSLGLTPPELPSYPVYEDSLLVDQVATSIYDLALEAGLDLTTDPSYQGSCPDPMNTWGRN
ncbi:hypothetical protein ACQUSY_11405 [Microbacterium sp. YY-03]|uniref:hypothetical protein n=1 Tax=Microbacterium sp. YY-03 TaxID=3421636 RepID=UPI003D175C48